MAYAAATHIGRRQRNEDSLQVPFPELIVEYRGHLFAVADGIGGHSGGAVASRMACQGLGNYCQNLKAAKRPLDMQCLSRHLCETMMRIDRQIRLRGRIEAELVDMGTTLSCLVLTDNKTIIAHVGDSRIYRLRGGYFTCLTTDHTLVQEMVFEGFATPEKAAVHPMRHLLTSSVGTAEPLEWIDSRIDRLCPGDRFLLCTDGLHDALTQARMAHILGHSWKPRRIAAQLIAEALLAGGKDNISVIVICLNGSGSPETIAGKERFG
jgi:protein phosphatase